MPSPPSRSCRTARSGARCGARCGAKSRAHTFLLSWTRWRCPQRAHMLSKAMMMMVMVRMASAARRSAEALAVVLRTYQSASAAERPQRVQGCARSPARSHRCL
eukprot:4291938-Pleurochrysis_carterae.AAC.2